MPSDITPETLVSAFNRQYQRKPAVLVRAPGRINLLGAHVDYNEGWVLPAAINRNVWLAAAPTNESDVTICSLDYRQQDRFSLDDLSPQIVSYPWLRYPLGVAWSLQKRGYLPVGMEVMLSSDVPIGAGVSSSGALEVALVLAWEALSSFILTNVERAEIGMRAENDYLGVGSGIMDQFASLHGAIDHLILLDCRTLLHELIPVPSEVAVIVVDSGVRRELTKVDYNSRPRECREAMAILRRFLPGARALRDVSKQAFELYAHLLPPRLRRRAEHVVYECARVLEGAEALRLGNVVAFGALIRQSQASSRDFYENSIPELDLLAETAGRVSGCHGARFAGGGFGGVMQVLVEKAAIPTVQLAMRNAFEESFGRTPPMFTCGIADGAEITML
jgi:galactokinase